MKAKIVFTFFISLFIFAALMLSAQVPSRKDTSKTKREEKQKAGIGNVVQQVQPQFPGGDDSLISFLKKNLRFPENAKKAGAHGTVLVGFIVDRTGVIRDEEVLNGENEELKAEAIRVIKSMPPWKPGTVGGMPTDVQYALSIDFTLK